LSDALTHSKSLLSETLQIIKNKKNQKANNDFDSIKGGSRTYDNESYTGATATKLNPNEEVKNQSEMLNMDTETNSHVAGLQGISRQALVGNKDESALVI
jgi:hypothetical protein